MIRSRNRVLALSLFFTLIACGLYFNSASHVFHLDSGHSIKDNPALRSLDRIPSYFRDPLTFSILLTNVDYRPVLQVSYALNYSLFGYDMPGWHWTNVLLHVWCAVFLYLFTFEFAREEFEDGADWAFFASLLTALLFLVHPMNSGVINYLSARSSQLTAAFLLPSFLLCLRGRHGWAILLFLAALFTKVEAVAAFAVFVFLMAWQARPLRSLKQIPWRPTLCYAAAAGFYLAVRITVMSGLPFAEAAGRSGMTAWHYLVTQLTAWWYYLLCWWVPVNLVADNHAYPAFSSPFHQLVVAALLAWGLVLVFLLKSWSTRPYRLLLALSGLALISPSSSVIPLAEMVNEHRPYLPVALVSILWIFPLVAWVRSWESRRLQKLALLLSLCWLVTLGALTVQRNLVFLSSESYWKDVLDKAPSARAHVNYGLPLMRQGRYEEALRHFQTSLSMAPAYHIAHINTAVALSALGRESEAGIHYDRAVETGRGDGVPLLWRARHFNATGQYERALQDLEKAQAQSNDKAAIYLQRARALAWMNKGEEASRWALLGGEIDFELLGRTIVEVATPFFRNEQTARQGVIFFTPLLQRWPKTWWAHQNQGDLLNKVGDGKRAQEHLSKSKELR